MSKEDFLERMRAGRADLNEAISNLTEDQMSQDLVTSEWTVKDVLAHLAAWQSETRLAILRAEAGEEVGPIINEGVDEWNAARVNERRRLPLVDVMQEFHAVYDELMAALARWPDDKAPLGPSGWDESAEIVAHRSRPRTRRGHPGLPPPRLPGVTPKPRSARPLSALAAPHTSCAPSSTPP